MLVSSTSLQNKPLQWPHVVRKLARSKHFEYHQMKKGPFLTLTRPDRSLLGLPLDTLREVADHLDVVSLIIFQSTTRRTISPPRPKMTFWEWLLFNRLLERYRRRSTLKSMVCTGCRALIRTSLFNDKAKSRDITRRMGRHCMPCLVKKQYNAPDFLNGAVESFACGTCLQAKPLAEEYTAGRGQKCVSNINHRWCKSCWFMLADAWDAGTYA